MPSSNTSSNGIEKYDIKYAAQPYLVSIIEKHGDDTLLSPSAVSKGGESKNLDSVPEDDIATG